MAGRDKRKRGTPRGAEGREVAKARKRVAELERSLENENELRTRNAAKVERREAEIARKLAEVERKRDELAAWKVELNAKTLAVIERTAELGEARAELERRERLPAPARCDVELPSDVWKKILKDVTKHDVFAFASACKAFKRGQKEAGLKLRSKWREVNPFRDSWPDETGKHSTQFDPVWWRTDESREPAKRSESWYLWIIETLPKKNRQSRKSSDKNWSFDAEKTGKAILVAAAFYGQGIDALPAKILPGSLG